MLSQSKQSPHEIVDPETDTREENQQSDDHGRNDQLEPAIAILVRLTAELVLWEVWRGSIQHTQSLQNQLDQN
jgi:hypothetical protein